MEAEQQQCKAELRAGRAHLQGSSSKVNARTRDGLRLEANKHVRPEAVVHVIPEKTKQHRLELHFAFLLEDNNTGDSIDFIIFSVVTLNM